MCVSPVAALVLGLALAAPLEVSLSDGGGCLTASAITRALAQRGVDPPAAGWRLVVLEAGSATASLRSLRLELHRPDGALALWRALEIDGAACQDAADAVALIVERHFRELGWAGPPPRVTSPAPAVVAGPEPAPVRPSRRVLALLGPMFWTRRTAPMGAAVELRLAISGPVHAALGLLVPGAAERQGLPGGGVARLTAWPLVLGVHLERQRGALAAHAGLDALATLERAASSSIDRPATGQRIMLAAGGSLGLAWLVTGRLRVTAEAGVSRLALGSDFEVGGLGPVLPPPTWQGRLGLRLGWVISP